MTDEKYFGALFSPPDPRDYKLRHACIETKPPETFELQLPFLKNQGVVGACVACSIAEVMEYHITKNGHKTEMSVGCIYGNRLGSANKGHGMVTREALKNAMTYGDVINLLFPELFETPDIITLMERRRKELFSAAYPHHITGFIKVSTAAEIKTALMYCGPVIFSINWYDDIKVINGVMRSQYKKGTGGHCMVIYGWNEDGWLIQNSWGTIWGNRGKAIMPYDFPIKEAWCIIDDFDESNIDKPFNSKIGSVFARVINKICNVYYLIRNFIWQNLRRI